MVIVVGLNTAFTLHEQPDVSLTLAEYQTWAPTYGIHFGLGLLVIGGIGYHLQRAMHGERRGDAPAEEYNWWCDFGHS